MVDAGNITGPQGYGISVRIYTNESQKISWRRETCSCPLSLTSSREIARSYMTRIILFDEDLNNYTDGVISENHFLALSAKKSYSQIRPHHSPGNHPSRTNPQHNVVQTNLNGQNYTCNAATSTNTTPFSFSI